MGKAEWFSKAAWFFDFDPDISKIMPQKVTSFLAKWEWALMCNQDKENYEIASEYKILDIR